MSILRGSKAPNLPIAPTQYEQRYADGLTNVQRLYYNTLDNITGALLSPGGGHYLSFPHIAAQDTTNQYAVTNTPTKVLWNQLDSGLGFTLNVNNSATAQYNGKYKIDYSLQFANTDSQIHEIWVWLRVNGVDVPGSASTFSVPNRHGGVDGYLVAYSSVVFEMLKDDYVELYWTTNLAYNPVGPVNGVYMEAYPASTSPFARPSIPSAIGSITFVCNTTV